MIIYHVSITIDGTIETEWFDWMRGVHVPDVLRTGCFARASIYKVIEPASDQPAYVIQYHCSSIDEYYRYRESFAPAVQKEHSDRFIGRFRASRKILGECE
jgi:hypothetical protein